MNAHRECVALAGTPIAMTMESSAGTRGRGVTGQDGVADNTGIIRIILSGDCE